MSKYKIVFFQNGAEKDESFSVLSMREVEESLVSVGALTVTNSEETDLSSDKITPDSSFINPSQFIQTGKKLTVCHRCLLGVNVPSVQTDRCSYDVASCDNVCMVAFLALCNVISAVHLHLCVVSCSHILVVSC